MILKIWQAGEPVLRQPARPLSPDEITGIAIQELIAHMQATMRDTPGVGLAAPQVGVPLQLLVIEDRPEYIQKLRPEVTAAMQREPVPFHVLVNPQLTIETDQQARFFEGCLSVAGFVAVVPRATRVQVDYLDGQGHPKSVTAQGWYARILQHEIDHLRGTLYLDRMESRTFSTVDNYTRYWKDKPIKDLDLT